MYRYNGENFEIYGNQPIWTQNSSHLTASVDDSSGDTSLWIPVNFSNNVTTTQTEQIHNYTGPRSDVPAVPIQIITGEPPVEFYPPTTSGHSVQPGYLTYRSTVPFGATPSTHSNFPMQPGNIVVWCSENFQQEGRVYPYTAQPSEPVNYSVTVLPAVGQTSELNVNRIQQPCIYCRNILRRNAEPANCGICRKTNSTSETACAEHSPNLTK